jgi:O-antigen/teichoic acid export membrane protein
MSGGGQPDTSDGRPGTLDAAVNLAGLGITGVSGVLLLGLIGTVYGAAELGRFNLVFAGYLIASQVATLAIHHGVLHHLGRARTGEDPQRRAVLLGALTAVVMSATVTVLVLTAVSGPVLDLVGRSDLAAGVRFGVLASGAFAINKVLLNALNALARFRAFGAAGALRGVLLLVSGGLLVALDVPGAQLPLLLLLAEGVLALILLGLVRRELLSGPVAAPAIAAWARTFLVFGVRGFAGGFLSDLNTRIDVLCLSLFVDDRALGIYSLAAVLAEAAHQVPIVVRSLSSPRVVLLLASDDQAGLRALLATLRRTLQPAMLVAGGLAVLLYPFAAGLLGGDGLEEGRLAFALLMAGVWLASAYTPFSLLLVQGGDATGNSLLLSAAVVINVVGNLLLIPILGINGAALATASTTVMTIVLLRLLAAKRLGVRL